MGHDFTETTAKALNIHFLFCFSIDLLSGDIYDKVQAELEAIGLDTECLGGGRIFHDPTKGTVLVYGYSQVRKRFMSVR